METKQDFFISHASADNPTYIQPLAECLTQRKVTYWLDSYQMSWGDSLALKVNAGLRDSRHVVLCLSEAFLSRPWPETELNSAFAIKLEDESRKVLPLILNNKERILNQYPLIAGLIYREYSSPEAIADDLASLVSIHAVPEGHIRVIIESIHTGHLSNIIVSPHASVDFLSDKAKRGTGLRESLDTGGFKQFFIRWVLVDVNAEEDWKIMDRQDQQKIHAIVKTESGIRIASHGRQRLSDLGIYRDMIFHLYAVEDIDKNLLGGGVLYKL
jgi:hypothetical protein